MSAGMKLYAASSWTWTKGRAAVQKAASTAEVTRTGVRDEVTKGCTRFLR
jgi:hypothetical protein